MAPFRSVFFVNRWTQVATVVTVASGLLVPATVLEVSPGWFWSVAALYFGLLTGGVYLAERSRSRWPLHAYISVATALLFGLLVAAHGWVWLIGLPLLSHVVLFTSWRWAVGWSVVMMGVVLTAAPPLTEWFRVGAGLGAAVTFVIAFSVIARREAEWRLRSEQLSESLAAANHQLRAHAVEVAELSAIRERNRVAREVHDGLGHYLTTIHVQLEAARALLDKDVRRARQGVERAQLLAKQGLQDVRESVALLRHAETESAPLDQVLAAVVSGDDDDGVQPSVSLAVTGVRRHVSKTVQHALRRVLQEALTNVRRHSAATRVNVRLRFEPACIVLDVEDNGDSVQERDGAMRECCSVVPMLDLAQSSGDEAIRTATPSSHGHGLSGIRERVHLLGGRANFGLAQGRGFRVEVTVPA